MERAFSEENLLCSANDSECTCLTRPWRESYAIFERVKDYVLAVTEMDGWCWTLLCHADKVALMDMGYRELFPNAAVRGAASGPGKPRDS